MKSASILAPVLIDGAWRAADSAAHFQAENPATGEKLATVFPVSGWADVDRALDAAVKAAVELRAMPAEKLAAFLEAYARNIEASADALVAAAHEETGLPVSPRLKDVELPRTTNQLRQAAAAAREESWKRTTLDTERNIRTCFASIGPVVVFGPNNFPFAFNGVSGGDFAAAIAAGNPVIAKAHPLHPNTTRLLAEEARKAAVETGMPSGTVQILYNVSNEDGLKLVGDKRVGAIGFTGSRAGGMRLKKAADEAGKPIYLEMSSINPVIFLPGALEESEEQLARELVDSCLAGAGQFCTSPNMILLRAGEGAEKFLDRVANGFHERSPQPLLSESGLLQIEFGVASMIGAGAVPIAGAKVVEGKGYRYSNTLLMVLAKRLLDEPEKLMREVFGNVTLAVTVENEDELLAILEGLEGNLTGTIYSGSSAADNEVYGRIEPILRRKVGRLLNNKMPTGVAVSPAMHHGGPFPATSHPGFTSVGIPASLPRFAMLACYDNVREDRLPAILRDKIDNAKTWRSINGQWVQG
jgi:2,5-dioxopentanoate dehydrogenase